MEEMFFKYEDGQFLLVDPSDYDDDLEMIQEVVGGCVEMVPLPSYFPKHITLWVNDIGKLIPLPQTGLRGSIADIQTAQLEVCDTLEGTLFFTGTDGIGDTIPLSLKDYIFVKEYTFPTDAGLMFLYDSLDKVNKLKKAHDL